MPATPDRPVTLASAVDLDAFVSEHDRALVEFHTEGCSLCDAMAPVLDGVAATADVAVATMNPRDDPELVSTYDVRSVPKLLAFVDGNLVGTREDGFLGVDEVTEIIRAEQRADDLEYELFCEVRRAVAAESERDHSS